MLARFYFRFEISVFYDHIFCFAFPRKKKCSRKNAVSPELLSPHSIYIHVCTLYNCMNTYLPRFNPSKFFGSSKCLIPTPRLTSSTQCADCVCVCVYTHIHPRTLPPTSKIQRHSDNTSICLSVKSNPPHQVTSTLRRLVEPHNTHAH